MNAQQTQAKGFAAQALRQVTTERERERERGMLGGCAIKTDDLLIFGVDQS